MKKFMQKKLKNEKGMTLIELLAVIVIIAIIAAIAIPAIANIIENSRVGAAKSDALSAFSAAELYLAENGDAFTATGQDGITGAELVTGGYLDDLGSFQDEDGTTNNLTGFTLSGTGDLLISGTASNDGVVLEFTAATKDQVSDMPNGTGDADGEAYPATGTATITVTR